MKKTKKTQKHVDIENRVAVTRREGVGRKAKCVTGISCVMKNGNQIFGCKHAAVHTEVGT